MPANYELSPLSLTRPALLLWRRSFTVAAETAKPGVMLSNMAPGLALQSTALEACLRLSFPQLKTVSFAHYAPRPSNSLAGKS